MQQALTDRVTKTREQIRDWRSARIDDLQETRTTLIARKDEAFDKLTHRRDEAVDKLSTRRADAVDTARERLITVQTTVLEAARDMLGWAGEQIGPRAEFVKRGEAALEDALVSLRAGHSATLPIDDFDGLSVKKVVAALDASDIDATGLRTLHAYEASNKHRKTLLADLDRRLDAVSAPVTAADAPAANDVTTAN